MYMMRNIIETLLKQSYNLDYIVIDKIIWSVILFHENSSYFTIHISSLLLDNYSYCQRLTSCKFNA